MTDRQFELLWQSMTRIEQSLEELVRLFTPPPEGTRLIIRSSGHTGYMITPKDTSEIIVEEVTSDE